MLKENVSAQEICVFALFLLARLCRLFCLIFFSKFTSFLFSISALPFPLPAITGDHSEQDLWYT